MQGVSIVHISQGAVTLIAAGSDTNLVMFGHQRMGDMSGDTFNRHRHRIGADPVCNCIYYILS